MKGAKSNLLPASRQVMAPSARRDGPRPNDVVKSPLGFGRETVESVVVAFTLALLFRAFEAEAFVIPTGSMAPTLMGRHKDLVCESCGKPYRVGCSAEVDDPARLVPVARCPNCGLAIDLVRRRGSGLEYDSRYPSFNGDRILVNKFAYDFAEPERWDVVVFRYPEDAKTNYIKRLVGLPGEMVSIAAGDIWTSADGREPRIARKPDQKMLAMLQVVHDSRHQSRPLQAAGWPTAWSDWSAPGRGSPAWVAEEDGRGFAVTCDAGGSAMLRFRHMLPLEDQWEGIRDDGRFIGEVRPEPITDYQPYNAMPSKPHWVGDLAVETVLESRSANGSVTLDLVEAGASHRCTIDLSTGEATLSTADGSEPPRATTAVRGLGSWTILFANVDDELRLFVDGSRVAFDRPTSREDPLQQAIEAEPLEQFVAPGDPTASDLAPAGIAAEAASVRVRDMRVLRDVYYLGTVLGARASEFDERERLDFPLEAGQYFVLGDNSSASKDSRLWNDGHHVDRRLLIGKAMLVFWPHAVPASWALPLKIGRFDLRLPSWPNFARMRFVR